MIRAERAHVTEDIERQKAALATVADNQAAVSGMVAMREALKARLEGATREDHRWIMQMLDVRVTPTNGGLSVSLGVPPHVVAAVADGGESVASFLSCEP